MTAELCDCFPTKRDGVLAVLDAVISATSGRPILVWGLDGTFHSPDEMRDRPYLAAAANWLALATVAAKRIEVGPGLLIDIGSTTTDVIPIRDGAVVALGRTDTERLQTGELVYLGVRRTPVFAVADRLTFRGRPTRLAAEFFATTHDVFLTLGEVPETDADLTTADGRPSTVSAARDRLARVVCADREGFEDQDARDFARAARAVLLERLVEGVTEVRASLGEAPGTVVVAGSGEFLAVELATLALGGEVNVVRLSEEWGRAASEAACARALLEILASSSPERPDPSCR
jgi:probable H4MPT-linked C1 transfer pathway protein